MVNGYLDELYFDKVLISVNDPDDHDLIDEICKSFEDYIVKMTRPYYLSEMTVGNQYSSIEANQKALDLLNLVFYLIIGIMMFLCFFSLQASMTANMYE